MPKTILTNSPYYNLNSNENVLANSFKSWPTAFPVIQLTLNCQSSDNRLVQKPKIFIRESKTDQTTVNRTLMLCNIAL